MSPALHITPSRHALARYRQRVGPPGPVPSLLRLGVRLPRRHGQEIAPCRRAWQKRTRVVVAGGTAYVVRGRVAVTAWPLSTDDLATVLVWACCGVWCGVGG